MTTPEVKILSIFWSLMPSKICHELYEETNDKTQKLLMTKTYSALIEIQIYDNPAQNPRSRSDFRQCHDTVENVWIGLVLQDKTDLNIIIVIYNTLCVHI